MKGVSFIKELMTNAFRGDGEFVVLTLLVPNAEEVPQMVL